MGNKWGKPYNCPSLLPWEFPGHQARRKEQGGVWQTRSWESVEKNVARVLDTMTERRKLYRKKILEVCKETPLSIHQSTGLAHIRVRKWPEAMERTIWKNWSNVYLATINIWKQCQFLPAKLENLKTHGALSSIIRKVLPQKWGMVSLRLNGAPTNLKSKT